MKEQPKKPSDHWCGPQDLRQNKPGLPEEDLKNANQVPSNNHAPKPEEEPVSEWPYGHFLPHSEKKGIKR